MARAGLCLNGLSMVILLDERDSLKWLMGFQVFCVRTHYGRADNVPAAVFNITAHHCGIVVHNQIIASRLHVAPEYWRIGQTVIFLTAKRGISTQTVEQFPRCQMMYTGG